MRKWLLTWWFVYSVTGASGQALQVNVASGFDTESQCNHARSRVLQFVSDQFAGGSVEPCLQD